MRVRAGARTRPWARLRARARVRATARVRVRARARVGARARARLGARAWAGAGRPAVLEHAQREHGHVARAEHGGLGGAAERGAALAVVHQRLPAAHRRVPRGRPQPARAVVGQRDHGRRVRDVGAARVAVRAHGGDGRAGVPARRVLPPHEHLVAPRRSQQPRRCLHDGEYAVDALDALMAARPPRKRLERLRLARLALGRPEAHCVVHGTRGHQVAQPADGAHRRAVRQLCAEREWPAECDGGGVEGRLALGGSRSCILRTHLQARLHALEPARQEHRLTALRREHRSLQFGVGRLDRAKLFRRGVADQVCEQQVEHSAALGRHGRRVLLPHGLARRLHRRDFVGRARRGGKRGGIIAELISAVRSGPRCQRPASY